MPPARAANTSKRTTPRKPIAAVPDFDAEYKRPKKAKTQLRAFGRVWDLKEPNAMIVRQMQDLDVTEDAEGNVDSDQVDAALTATFVLMLGHVSKDQRDDFVKAANDDEDFDLAKAYALLAKMSEVVYAIPSSPSGS